MNSHFSATTQIQQSTSILTTLHTVAQNPSRELARLQHSSWYSNNQYSGEYSNLLLLAAQESPLLKCISRCKKQNGQCLLHKSIGRTRCLS
mmetsp:Transcript_13166/g.20074  ORF Transcript_13166/g.20074 Transcript_13166/m.20074 type:complete len:91 (-) Transcript_13166:915-1187(-)